MFTLAGPAGFYGTPVTKVLLLHAILTYFLLQFPLHHLQHLFHYNHDPHKHQWKKMVLSKLVFLELPELIFSSILLYNFRIFERRFGSRKFVSFLLTTTILACLLELLAFSLLNRLDVQLDTMPSGLLSTVFPLYVPFYLCIPRVASSTALGVPVTGKTVNYILGLQMAASSRESLLLTLCALVAGALWWANFMKIQSLVVPPWLARTFDLCLGRYLESSDKTTLPMGATLELQQRERLDRIEQQMMATAMRASTRVGRPLNLPLANGIFNNLEQQPSDEASSAPSPANAPVSEDQVRRFVEMGFGDSQVRHALRAANNNPGVATNLLLQGT